MLLKRVVTFIVIVAFLIPSFAFAENEALTENRGDKDIISIEQAKQVVENDISTLTPEHEFFDLWKEVDVVFSSELYDITESVIGYYFKLMNSKGTNVGYYITGARSDITPILQYSASPHEDFEKRDKTLKIYYFSGKNFTFAQNADILINQLNDMLSDLEKNQRNQTTIDKKTLMDQLTFNRNENAPSLWNQLSDNKVMSVSSYPSAGWLDVTRIYQRLEGVDHPKSACGPTSLAMAIQYLSSLGYNVHDVSHFNYSFPQMINGYYNFLSSNFMGTSSGNMSFLVPTLLNMYMTGWTSTSVDADSSGAMDKFKDRIVSSRPPLVMWDQLSWFPWIDADVYWHWQTGNAYRTSGGAFQFGVKDPDNGINNTSTIYYSWIDNQNGFMFVSYKQS
ncbi:hypothetical protein PA598K_02341 [Paenibacillus sp. 598K]|uniref:hypothetical protein n=1 Tax=Paenibacillus sp. 598K TaxID=1117987 RepID=UPI000FFA13B0|nr:hypothetical protein [Paenibacillus sp. 598K]GBF74012.1 hypothetical protein PA598K_02341 [Paenibacillus sp. 598K]